MLYVVAPITAQKIRLMAVRTPMIYALVHSKLLHLTGEDPVFAKSAWTAVCMNTHYKHFRNEYIKYNLDGIILKIEIHSSCEIEYFVETHFLQAVRSTPIARNTVCVSSLRI